MDARPIEPEGVGVLLRKGLIEWKKPLPRNPSRKSDYYLL